MSEAQLGTASVESKRHLEQKPLCLERGQDGVVLGFDEYFRVAILAQLHTDKLFVHVLFLCAWQGWGDEVDSGNRRGGVFHHQKGIFLGGSGDKDSPTIFL